MALHAGLIGTMQTKLVDYTSYVKARRTFSIFTNLWEKTFRKLFLDLSNEFTNQLLYCQSKMIDETEVGGLAEGIHRACLNVLVRCVAVNDYLRWK